MSSSPDEGDAAVGLGESGRNGAGWVDRQQVFGGDDRLALRAVGVQVVPDRDRHAEEALARDEPVTGETADPVLVPHPHVVGSEVDLLPGLDEAGTQLGVARTVLDVPLAGGDDLERLVALLEELHGVRDRLGITDHLAAGLEQLDDLGLGAEYRLAGELRVRGPGGIRHDRLRSVGHDATVGADDGAVGQVELAPPHDVGHVAEGADHGDARTLVFLGEVVRHDGHLDAEDRGRDAGAEQRLVALVVGVRNEGHARGEQFGAGRLDVDVVATVTVESEAVVGRRLLLVLELRLRDSRAERDVPQCRSLGLVRLAARQVAHERALRGQLGLVPDGAVRQLPVDAQSELAPQVLELLLVFSGEGLAELDEVASRDRLLVCRLG